MVATRRPILNSGWRNYLRELPDANTELFISGLHGGTATVIDDSGSGNTGAINDATWKRTKQGLWYLYHDGADDYVSFGDPSFTSDVSGSVGEWIYPTTELQNTILCYSKLSTATVDEFQIQADTRGGNAWISIIVFNNTVQTHNLKTPVASVPVNKWTNWWFTSSGTAHVFYINGASVTITETTGTADGDWFGDMVTDADLLVAGAIPRSGGYTLELTGGEAILEYSSATLSAYDIAKRFEHQKSAFGVR